MKLNLLQTCAIFLIITLTYTFIDQPLALWIEENLRSNAGIKMYSSNIPSMLLLLVIVVSSSAWAIYGYMRLRNIASRHLGFFLILGVSLPVAYAVKTLLKWVFGRIGTRLWLMEPQDYGLHWFNGYKGYDAFPSGHMLVITQIFLAVWFFYPRLRLFNFMIWSGLAIVLILTNYHFLSDVIAGAYIGMVLYWLVSLAVNRRVFI